MSEATISFADHDQIRQLLGTQDRVLKRIREVVGIDVVFRDDELTLLGDSDRVARGVAVFEELRNILKTKGVLQEREINAILVPEPNTDTAESTSATPLEFDLLEKAKSIAPRSAGQADYVAAMKKHELVFCAGPAGTGKTFLAVAAAINALRTEQVRKIVLVRPAVEAGEKLGFLPGDLLAKVNPFLRPLLDALTEMLDFEQVKRYLENDVVEIIPLAFMRGRTLNQTFIILDEAQNTTITQMKMFLTRMGADSKIVITGDPTQVDLPPNVSSGMSDSMRRLKNIKGIAQVNLTGEDIVRHRLVREIVQAYDQS